MAQQTTEDRLTILRETFGAGPAAVLDLSGAFQVDFGPERRVYVYVETEDGSITARYETKEPDAEKRVQSVAAVQKILRQEIPVAEIAGFREAQALKGRFVYTAQVKMDPAVFYHQTIIIGSEVTGEPAAQMVVAEQPSPAAKSPTRAPEGPDEGIPCAVAIEAAILEMEAVDAKMLRQGLDMMNLKRSSLVRAALARLFRSIGDVEELTKAVANEAAKIVSPEDREDLSMIRTIHGEGFLKPAIALLYDAVFYKS